MGFPVSFMYLLLFNVPLLPPITGGLRIPPGKYESSLNKGRALAHASQQQQVKGES